LPVRFVTPDEIEREKRELREIRAEYDRRLRRQYQLNTNRLRAERRVKKLEEDLVALRARGWVYLSGGERRYWRSLVDRLIPEARRRLEYWTWETDRHFREDVKPVLERIRKLEEELKEKVIPKLYRIKIRLYAVKKRKEYYLTFQGFFDIDAILNPETGLPVWDWWLTKQEIQIAKYHFHGYWKGGVKKPKPFTVGEIELGYQTDLTGASLREYLEKTTEFRYTKDVPEEYKRLARTMTLGEIIVGLSNIKPRPTDLPEGVFFEYAMIIDEDGYIKWMERRDRWAWKPPAEIVDRVRKELGI